MRILITGFVAFDGSLVNPSEKMVRALAGSPPASVDLHTLILPVDTHQAPALLRSALESLRPQAVVCFGEASGRACISLERVAINLLDFRIPDNTGAQIVDAAVLSGAPDAYFSSLPLRRLQQALGEAGIPVELSLSAGAYLCNQVFFEVLHWRALNDPSMAAGFIHLPSLPEQVAQKGAKGPSMSLETLQSAGRLILQVLAAPDGER